MFTNVLKYILKEIFSNIYYIMNIPECIFHKIMLYNSHPVADIVKNSINSTLSGNFDKDENGITYQWIYFAMRDDDNSDTNEDKLVYSNGYDYSDDFAAEAESEIEIVESEDEDLYELVIKNKQTNQVKIYNILGH